MSKRNKYGQIISALLKRTRWYHKLMIGILLPVVVFGILHIIFPLKVDLKYSTIVYDNRGELIHAFLTPDEKWRMQTRLEEISPLLQKTILAKEDKYFYSHPGINPFAISRALVNNLWQGKRTSGASTITMQVAKALYPARRTYVNKLFEIFRAFQLELGYSKKEILQLYLNILPYGGNIEGVKSASLLYFNKNPDHLSLAEITALSIIPNRPSSLVPGKHNRKIIEERNKWLHRFAEEDIFTKAEIKDALEEPFDARRLSTPRYIPHLANHLKARSGSDLIQTNIHISTQLKIEELVAAHIRSAALQNISNAAVVVIDNQRKKVVAYVGSADFYNRSASGQVNGVAAVRQPGSTLKPLVYAMAIDKGIVTPKTILTDVAINYEGYSPENYDRNFNGYVSVENALGHSLNIPAVKTLSRIGVDEMISKLSDADFRQVRADQRKLGLSMILGGCGATLEELTGLYSAFAQNGIYYRASKINEKPAPGKRLISAEAAYMITGMLSRVNRPDFPLNWQSTQRMPKIAWKTGTSYGRRDGWSIGYNKRFTVGVWCGNFSGKGSAALSGANTATPLLFKIFNTIDYDSDQEWFDDPGNCESRVICAETGMIPSDHCTNIISDQFIPLVSSTEVCNHMQELKISADEKLSYCNSCMPVNGYRKKLFSIVPAEMQNYFRDRNIIYAKIPPHNPDCELIFREAGPSILSPANGAEYLISSKTREPLMLKSKTGNDVSKVHWYINNRYFRSSDAGSSQFFVPEEGPVKISCTDDKGRNRDIWIRVKYVDL